MSQWISRVETVLKPEYIFRPSQALHRCRISLASKVAKDQRKKLPWGHEIDINCQEAVGKAIWQLGLYDLVVSECLWRLIEPGETVVDAGANIGYMTSLMSRRTGKTGKTFSFEPHPEILKRLKRNTQQWSKDHKTSSILVVEKGLSSSKGEAFLAMPEKFSENEGVAFVTSEEKNGNFRIELTTLEAELEGEKPKVMKVDVEGHELELMKGAGSLLQEQKIRDIVFEDHEAYPTPPMRFLEEAGYTLFRLKRSFWGPQVSDAKTDHSCPAWEPANILATANPERALRKLSQRGWSVLNA